MANRFLDTNYYKSPFVRSLKGHLKSLYSFIICDCDGAGIWNMDMQAATMYTGFDYTIEEFEINFVNMQKAIPIGGGKYFFPDFIEHQYPSGLQVNNKAHKNFISILTKYGLIDNNQQIIKNEAPLEDALKASHVQSRSSNGLGQVEGGVGEEKFIVPQMVRFWSQRFPSYVSDQSLDSEGMGKILFFIHKKRSGLPSDPQYQSEILATLGKVADEVERDAFWVNKSVKSIANNIQEFFNKIKNPTNGKSTTNKAGRSIEFDKL